MSATSPKIASQSAYSIRAVTVYCSSSGNVARAFFDAAAALGHAIAVNRWKLVYGGNSVGMMGVLANAARAAGGSVIGVTPQLFIDKRIHDQKCEELIITATLRQRKAVMEDRGDAFIALPGGLGTFEEIFEIICAKQLACHNKPVVLLNIDDYYAPLVAMIEHGIKLNFIRARAGEVYFVALDVELAFNFLRRFIPPTPAPAPAPAHTASAEPFPEPSADPAADWAYPPRFPAGAAPAPVPPPAPAPVPAPAPAPVPAPGLSGRSCWEVW
jgi:uncharacterized protein (TIGR00730 family)